MPLGSPDFESYIPPTSGDQMADEIQRWFTFHEEGPMGEVRGNIRRAMNHSDKYHIGDFGNRTEDDGGDEPILAGAGVEY